MVADVSTDRGINIPRKYSGKILNHFFTKWIARQNLKLNGRFYARDVKVV